MTITESVHAIMSRSELVVDLFYVKYLDRYPELRDYFEGVEMDQQAVLLTMALTVTQQFYTHRYPAAEQYLFVLGQKHHLRQIPRSLYGEWRDCLLDALQQSLPDDWNGTLEREWTEAINLATEIMHRGYDDDLVAQDSVWL